ncbi:hypothetical protein ICW40_13490 [Actinotalea ferrariae]|uniref:hypothetical protein n=1 Tax=Actinotalea ferrariae TaxID=1386098 RepID=UPI001C8BE6B8|nr:hypothetical protein [Actinotalea ferrariae]MBX9245816.1 hypothetical protein [Actinotalea ferrariae]
MEHDLNGHPDEGTAVRPARRPVRGVVVAVAGLGLMLALSAATWGRLPAVVTLVGGGKDGADAHIARLVLVTLMPVLLVLLSVLLLLAQRLRRRTAAALAVPMWRTDANHARSVTTALSLLTPVVAALHVLLLRFAVGDERTGMVVLAVAVALVVGLIANALPGTPVDLAQSRALRLEERPSLDHAVLAVRRGQRQAGPVVVVLALVAMALAFVAPPVSLTVSVVAVVAMAAVTGVVAVRSARGGTPVDAAP